MAVLREANEKFCIRTIQDGLAPGDFRNVDATLAASRCRRL
jgi:hypothetical protein